MKTPVAILDRLFGRKPQDSASLSARLDATHIALDEARQRQASADERCKAAMVSADRPAFLSAKADGEAAEFDAGVASGEIEALSVALAAAIEAERAEARAAALAALIERRRALADRFAEDWMRAAKPVAAPLRPAPAKPIAPEPPKAPSRRFPAPVATVLPRPAVPPVPAAVVADRARATALIAMTGKGAEAEAECREAIRLGTTPEQYASTVAARSILDAVRVSQS